jgi:DNA invertase Pin-like site-specific DNA recombinase
MKNVIIYSRVARPDNANEKLAEQTQLLTKYCKNRELNIVQEYSEVASGSSFDRKEFTKLLGFIKSNKGQIDTLLITNWDRFTRNTSDALFMLKHLKGYGVNVNSIQQPLDLSIPSNKAMLAFYLCLPEFEKNKLSLRTKEGIKRAKDLKEMRKHLIRFCDDPNQFEKFRKEKLNERFQFVILTENVKTLKYRLWACENKNELSKMCLELSKDNTVRVAKSSQEGIF